MSNQSRSYQRVVDRLQALLARADDGDGKGRAANRATLAQLRQGPESNAGPVVYAQVVDQVLGEASFERRETAYAIAELFAIHASLADHANVQAPGVSLGQAFHAMWVKTEHDRGHEPDIHEPAPAAAGRFKALLAADRDGVLVPLRQAVRMLGAASIPLDWAMLANHLSDWSRDDRRVQKDLARHFWAPPRRDPAVTSV